jgi:hypothetical protein
MSQGELLGKRKLEEARTLTRLLNESVDKVLAFQAMGDSIVRLYEEALSLGLTRKDEIECHARLGGVFFLIGSYFDGIDKVFETGLDSTLCFQRCITEMEKALHLDAQRCGEFFLIEEDANVLLGSIVLLWAAHSHFLRQAHKIDANFSAISYLADKVKLMDHLWDSYSSLLFFELGCLYADRSKMSVLHHVENRDKAIMWFSRAVIEATGSDVVSPFDIKSRAQEELEKLSVQS